MASRSEFCDHKHALVHTYDRLCNPSEVQRKHDQSIYTDTDPTDQEATEKFCKEAKPGVERLRALDECCTRLPTAAPASMDLRDYMKTSTAAPSSTCRWPGMPMNRD